MRMWHETQNKDWLWDMRNFCSLQCDDVYQVKIEFGAFGSIFEETIIIGPSSSNRVKNRAFANKFS